MYPSIPSIWSVFLLFPIALSIGFASSSPVMAQQQAAQLQLSEAPTEAEIETAYQQRIADLNGRSRKLLGAEDAALMALTLEDLEKLVCRGLDRVGVHFDCRVQIRMRQADRRPKTDVVNLWLSYEDSTWVVR